MKRSPLKRSQKPIARVPVKRKRSKPRRGPERDPKYLTWIRTQFCLVCWKNKQDAEEFVRAMVNQGFTVTLQTECAHVGERGLGQKCSDRETIPICAEHHRTGPESHHVLGKSFWKHHGLDKDALIKELNRLYDASRYVAEQFYPTS